MSERPTGLAATEGGRDLKKSDVLAHNRVLSPRSAASDHGVGNEGDSSVAAVVRYRGIQTASSESKSLQNKRGQELAALAQAGERDAAMADGRPHGGASDGAVLVDHQCITCELASPSQPSSHAPTPLTFPRDGVGAWRSSQPSVLVVLAPLASSGAAERPEQTAGTGQRTLRVHGRRAGRMVRSLVISPRSRC